MGRAGRPRKVGRRAANGRLARMASAESPDRGTPELANRKRQVTGSESGDLSLLGMLLGRGFIDEDHHQAARDFAACYHLYIGKPLPRPGALERLDRSTQPLDERAISRAKARFWNYDAALRAAGPGLFDLVRNLAVFDQAEGLAGEIIVRDLVRREGGLASRNGKTIPAELRRRIGAVSFALQVLRDTPRPKANSAKKNLPAAIIGEV